MSGYHLRVLHSRLVSREHAVWAWEEADRIEARTLHAGVVDALREIGWVVDVDDSEADYGRTRWLLWVKDVNEVPEMVAGTPLGYLDLLKPVSQDLEDAVVTREWRERVRVARGGDPEPPAAGNIIEQLLGTVPLRTALESIGITDTTSSGVEDALGSEASPSRGFGDAEKVLVSWAMYCNLDRAARAGKGGPIVELRDNLREKTLRLVQDTRECADALARLADLEAQKADKRAILGEFGVDPDTEPV